MKAFALILTAAAVVASLTSFKMAGKGENRPTVQSAFDGGYYVRTVPSADEGTEGKTQIYKVTRTQDELLGEYPVFMRGKLHLGWSPSKGQWCLVHLEPERIISDQDRKKVGMVSRLVFYMGGKELKTYTHDDLEHMGLQHEVSDLRQSGDFIVRGIIQIPRTNDYVFSLEVKEQPGGAPKTILLDITTGKEFLPAAEKK